MQVQTSDASPVFRAALKPCFLIRLCGFARFTRATLPAKTANIKDGSMFTADMAVQNFVGDAFRGATWVSLHNGGGVGWGEVINGGFGMLIDGSEAAKKRIESMLHWDVNNGVARRAWARNPGAIAAISQAMSENNLLKVTLPNLTDDSIFDEIMK